MSCRGNMRDERQSLRRYPAYLFVVGLAILLLIGSLMPGRMKISLGTVGPWHRPLHIMLFAAIAAAILVAHDGWIVAKAILLIAFALILEMAEHFLYHSELEWRDVRDDTVGIIAGLCFTELLLRIKRDAVYRTR